MNSPTVLLLCLLIQYSMCSLSCLDQKGNEVDWYFLLKLGSNVDDGGFTYAYFDANSNGRYVIGSMEKDDNPVARTVMQLGLYVPQSAPDDVGYLIYNDQTYDSFTAKHATSHYEASDGSIYGHTKGFVGFDSESSFWMIHSAPGFPYNHSMAPTYWHFPYGQTMFGQHFFCTNFKLEDIETIASQIIYYFPWVYDHNIPPSQSSSFPTLESIIKGEKKSGMGHVIDIKSRAGATMKGTSKSGDSFSDLYQDVLAPTLGTSLKVMCWCGGTFGYECAPPSCRGQEIVDPSAPQQNLDSYLWDVTTIGEMYFGTGNEFNVTYNHAKWALSYNVTAHPEPWFCAADINREYSQRKRGGGTLCLHDKELWDKLNYSVIRSYNTTCEE